MQWDLGDIFKDSIHVMQLFQKSFGNAIAMTLKLKRGKALIADVTYEKVYCCHMEYS